MLALRFRWEGGDEGGWDGDAPFEPRSWVNGLVGKAIFAVMGSCPHVLIVFPKPSPSRRQISSSIRLSKYQNPCS
jgi:hypothetical protein